MQIKLSRKYGKIVLKLSELNGSGSVLGSQMEGASRSHAWLAGCRGPGANNHRASYSVE